MSISGINTGPGKIGISAIAEGRKRRNEAEEKAVEKFGESIQSVLGAVVETNPEADKPIIKTSV